MKKEIKVFDDCIDIVNCFFAREWFVVAEKQRVMIYDQKKSFQKLLIFDNMSYLYSTMKYADGNFFFAFADQLLGELNILFLLNSDNYSSITSSLKEKRGLVVFSNDLKYCAYTTLDTKMLKVFSVSNFKKALYETKLSGHNPVTIYLITEHIVLIYYDNNSFELRDLSKSVKSYFIFNTHLVLKFVLSDALCLYEYNTHTRPIIDYEIKYYDKKSIKSVDIVS